MITEKTDSGSFLLSVFRENILGKNQDSLKADGVAPVFFLKILEK
jgi:hypothetical protein